MNVWRKQENLQNEILNDDLKAQKWNWLIVISIVVLDDVFLCECSTVWKFQDFSVFQKLREINFGQYRSSKTAVFAIFETLNFVDLENYSLQKVKIS